MHTREQDFLYTEDAFARIPSLEERVRQNEQDQFKDDLNPNESPLSWKEFFWSWISGLSNPHG